VHLEHTIDMHVILHLHMLVITLR